MLGFFANYYKELICSNKDTAMVIEIFKISKLKWLLLKIKFILFLYLVNIR